MMWLKTSAGAAWILTDIFTVKPFAAESATSAAAKPCGIPSSNAMSATLAIVHLQQRGVVMNPLLGGFHFGSVKSDLDSNHLNANAIARILNERTPNERSSRKA